MTDKFISEQLSCQEQLKKKKKMETLEFKSAGVIRELPSTEAAKIPERREK